MESSEVHFDTTGLSVTEYSEDLAHWSWSLRTPLNIEQKQVHAV